MTQEIGENLLATVADSVISSVVKDIVPATITIGVNRASRRHGGFFNIPAPLEYRLVRGIAEAGIIGISMSTIGVVGNFNKGNPT
nr:hypothetical protein [Oxobacter pfennigii]